MPSFENRNVLAASLSAFTGPLPQGYAGEREFYLTTLLGMGGCLCDLQAETLKDVCDRFLALVAAGKAPPRAVEAFRSELDLLVSAADFRLASSGLAGSWEFLRQRLWRLKPVSLFAGAREGGLDADAARKVKAAYDRMLFRRLTEQAAAGAGRRASDSALACARRAVGEYCAVYRVRVSPEDSLSPFSLASVDAALAASYQFYREVAGPT